MPTPRKYSTDAERAAAYRARKHAARLAELQAKAMPAMPSVPTIPGTRRWSALAQQASLLLKTMQDEMQGYYSDRSSTWQESDKGQQMQDRLERLEEVLGDLERWEGEAL